MNRFVLIHHLNGNELIIFGNSREFKENKSIDKQSRVSHKFENNKLNSIFRELIQELNPRIINVPEIHNSFTHYDLLSVIVHHSNSIQNLKDLCICYPERNHYKTAQGIKISKNLFTEESLISDEEKKVRSKDVIRFMTRTLDSKKQFLILHKDSLNQQRTQTNSGSLNSSDNARLFLKIKDYTQQQLENSYELVNTIQNIIDNTNIQNIKSTEYVNYLHFTHELFKINEKVSDDKNTLYLKRIFNSLQVNDKIVSAYYMNLRSQHLNTLKLFEVKHSGVREPFLNTYEILKYKRRNVVYDNKLENYLVRRKEDFIWFKVNATREDKYNYFDDILVDVFLYESGVLEMIIAENNKITEEELRNYFGEIVESIEKSLGKPDFYSFDSTKRVMMPSFTDLFSPIDHTSMVRNLKYKLTMPLRKNFSKKLLLSVLGGLGNKIQIMQNEKNYHLVFNLKIGDCVSMSPFTFLIDIEKSFYKYEIPNNMERFSYHLRTKYEEADFQKNVEKFLSEFFYNKRTEISITMGPVIRVRKTNLRSFQLEIDNIHDLKTLEYTKMFCKIIHTLLEENKTLKKVKKTRQVISPGQEQEGEDEEQMESQDFFADEDLGDFDFDDQGIVDNEDADLLQDILGEEEDENEEMKGDEEEQRSVEVEQDEDEDDAEAEGDDAAEEIDLNTLNKKSYLLDRLKSRQPILFGFKAKPGQLSYPRSCDKLQGRQPIILNQREFYEILDRYAPALDDSLKDEDNYREFKSKTREEQEEYISDSFIYTKLKGKKQYYICPKYWYILENRPISKEEILEKNLKDKIVDPTVFPKERYEDYNKNRFILSRYSPTEYFGVKHNRNPEQGQLEFEYGDKIIPRPGFLKNKHPEYGVGKKLGEKGCLPCCFKYIEPTKKKKGLTTRQKRIQKCHEEYDGVKEKEGNDNKKRGQDYILKKQKFQLNQEVISLLPSKLDNFIFHERKCLDQNSRISTTIPGCVFRMGINGKEDDNLFKTMRIVSGSNLSQTEFVERIVNEFTLDMFVYFYMGNLPKTFYNKEVQVPREEEQEIERLYSDTLDTLTKDENMRNYYISAFYNFREYTKHPHEIKLIDFYWEFFNNVFPFGDRVNIVVFEMKGSNDIMIKCPQTGLTKLHYDDSPENPIPHIFLLSYKHLYQPLFFLSHTDKRKTRNYKFYPSIIMKYGDIPHTKHIFQSIRYMLSNYTRQCGTKNDNNFSLFDSANYLGNEFTLKGERFVLKNVYIGKDNKVHIIEYKNVDSEEEDLYSLALLNQRIEPELFNSEYNISVKKVSEYKKQQYGKVRRFIDSLIKEYPHMENAYSIDYYGLENYHSRYTFLVLKNGGFLPVQPFMKPDVPVSQIYERRNTSEFLDYIFTENTIEPNENVNNYSSLNVMTNVIMEELEKSYPNEKMELLLTAKNLTDFSMYVIRNQANLTEFIDEKLTERVVDNIPIEFINLGFYDIKTKYAHLIYDGDKIIAYRIHQNRRDIIKELVSEILNLIYSDENIRNVLRNKTYKYIHIEQNKENAILLSEQELNGEDILNLRKIQSDYIQNENHYEVINLEEIKDNVIETFYGYVRETKPIPVSGTSTIRVNWRNYLENSILLVVNEKPINGWETLCFSIMKNLDIDDFKEEYIQKLSQMFERNPEQVYAGFREDGKEKLIEKIVEDDIEESLGEIVNDTKYYISRFDLKNIAKIFDLEIIVLKKSPVISGTTRNYGTKFANKTSKNMIILFETNIPAEEFNKYEVVMIYYNKKNEYGENYRPVHKKKSLQERPEYESFLREIEKWTSGNKKQMEVINV